MVVAVNILDEPGLYVKDKRVHLKLFLGNTNERKETEK